MNKIYTVFGESGEYSDWRMWAVRAFDNRDDAEKFCAVLNDIAQSSKERWSKYISDVDDSIGFGEMQDKLTQELRSAGDEASYFDQTNSFKVQEIDFGLPVQP